MQPIITADLASPRFKASSHPFYARLRDHAPVSRVRLSRRRMAWLVTRYDDVLRVLKDPRFVKDRLHATAAGDRVTRPWTPAFLRPLSRNMLDVDEPDHTRLRTLVHTAFTPRLIERLRERIQSLADGLLDAAECRGTAELVADYALPIPATVIADLLGVPATDQHRFHRWSATIVAVSSGRDFLGALPHAFALLRYLRALIARRRMEPRDDLITGLVQAEEAGDRLSEDEMLAMVFLLLVAGHETTVNLIASGTLALLEHPEQRKRLSEEPALIRPAIEELLRFTSPVELATERYASDDVEIAGTMIPCGALVLVALGSANWDARQFTDPDRLDLTREPNRHLAFGQGPHYCLGASLARLEGQIAIATLFGRLPDLRLVDGLGATRWRRGLFLRGLEQLPVTW
jgi:cytochrome P450 PksS